MTKYKVCDLDDPRLDAAVAKCLNLPFRYRTRHRDLWVEVYCKEEGTWRAFKSCTSWADGGPIMESHRIDTQWTESNGGQWVAMCRGPDGVFRTATGKTILRAAMVVFVVSELGETLE